VSNTPRPLNRATPSQAPKTKPTLQANAQAQALTATDRPTMAKKTGSKETINCSAVCALSVNEVITWGIVAAKAITHHM
jgi:hypothetical protein